MNPLQQAAYDAIKRYVKLVGGNVDEIVEFNNSYSWTDPKGTVHRIGWETHQ